MADTWLFEYQIASVGGGSGLVLRVACGMSSIRAVSQGSGEGKLGA